MGAPVITRKIDQDETRADFAGILAGLRLAIKRASNDRRDRSCALMEQVARQWACRLDDYQPPPALRPPSADTSGDRPDLPADDWTVPSTAEPVAASAIGSVVGPFAGAAAAMRSDCIARQQEQKN